MKLLHATGNLFKYNLMKERLRVFPEIELVNPKMLNINIDVLEDGTTAEENSIKKAEAYYKASNIPTIAEDTGLYIDKFSDDEQPGLFVKRVNHQEGLSDSEILEYYVDKLNEYGGSSKAHYFTGVAIVDNEGITHSKLINETEFLLTSKKCDKKNNEGGVLGCISYDINADKYFTERTIEEELDHYKKLNNEYYELIKEYILKK